MNYINTEIDHVAVVLRKRLKSLEPKSNIMKAVELKALADQLKSIPPHERPDFGRQLNELRNELMAQVNSQAQENSTLPPIDVTAPIDINVTKHPELLPSSNGSAHPLTVEIDRIVDIYARMGFSAVESRQLDDDFHMFTSLNFPEDHPARDEYDTFMTKQTDSKGSPLIAPAHTSVMQTRILKANKHLLETGQSIAYVVPGRIFRNEDLDARHEHTFHQLEGIYVAQNVTIGNLIAVLTTFFESYYGKTMEIKTNPFYFPFTEPSLEFSIACPFCDKAGCKICGEGWLEMLGCGMINPNVLQIAGIDPEKYNGFAWGGGIDRLVMIKDNIEDVRHFHSAKLDFLRQF